MRQKYLYLFFFFLCLPSYLFAQSDSVLMKKYQGVIHQFYSQEAIAFRLDYHLTSLAPGGSPPHHLQMDLWKKGKKSYLRFSDYEIYQDAQHYLYIDKVAQTIERREVKEAPNLSSFLNWAAMEQLLEHLDMQGKVSQLTSNKHRISFVATPDNKTLLELDYDPQTYFIYRSLIALDLKETTLMNSELNGLQMEVHFSNYQLDNIRLPMAFDQIIKYTQGNYKGVGNYRSYKVL